MESITGNKNKDVLYKIQYSSVLSSYVNTFTHKIKIFMTYQFLTMFFFPMVG